MIDRTPRMTRDEYRRAVGLDVPLPTTRQTQHDHCKAVRSVGADGSIMASKAEANRSHDLDLLHAAGEVSWWRPQVRIPCGLSEDGRRRTYYVVDFMIGWADGRVTFEDVKAHVDSNKAKRDALRELGLHVETVAA